MVVPSMDKSARGDTVAWVNPMEEEKPDMERGEGGGGRQVYFCVRPATVRGAASIQSAAFPDMIRPGATVVVSEEREVDGHRRALLESEAQAGWVSLSTRLGKELFEPLDGTSLLVRSAVRAVLRK